MNLSSEKNYSKFAFQIQLAPLHNGGSGGSGGEDRTDGGGSVREPRLSAMKSGGSGGGGGVEGASRSGSMKGGGGSKRGSTYSGKFAAASTPGKAGKARGGGSIKKGFVGRVAERVMMCGKIDAFAATGEGHVMVVEVGPLYKSNAVDPYLQSACF